jgi:hypothetical protein
MSRDINGITSIRKEVVSRIANGIVAQVSDIIQKGFFLYVESNTLLLVFLATFILSVTMKWSSLIQRLLYSLLMNSVLDAMESVDAVFSALNLFCAFIVCSSFIGNSEIGGSAQYIAAMRIANLFDASSFLIVIVLAVAYFYLQGVTHHKRIADTSSMICVFVLQKWVLSLFPTEAHTLCIIIALYAIAPFVEVSTTFTDLFNVLMVAATTDVYANDIPIWLQIVGVGLLWFHFQKTTSNLILHAVMLRLIQLMFLQYMQSHLGASDPILVYCVCIVCLQLFDHSLFQ